MAFKCPSCSQRTEFSDDDRRKYAGKFYACPKCGVSKKLPESIADNLPAVATQTGLVFCRDCGEKIKANAEICIHCGVRQQAANSGASSTGPSRVIAALLAFFVGGLGAHRFYLGERYWGALYLTLLVTTGWLGFPLIILCIVCLAEGIQYLMMSESQFAAKYQRCG